MNAAMLPLDRRDRYAVRMSALPGTIPPAPRYGQRLAWGFVRILGAVVILAAVFAQLSKTLEVAGERSQHLPTVLWNFFSFFTVLSNVMSALALIVAGVWILARGKSVRFEPRIVTVFILCTGTYMVITGIVYNLLLRGIPLPQGATVPWSNEVLHVVGPIILLLELLLRVARPKVSWAMLWAIIAFPIAWIIYTLTRGEHITPPATGQPWWYPYPFLNPYLVPGGYLGVGLYILGIAAATIAVGALVVWWTRRGADRRSAVKSGETADFA